MAFANGHGAWTDDQIVALARRIAVRKLPLFRSFPDMDVEDLTNEAAFAIHRAKAAFDPNRGCQFSTFAYTVGWRAIRAVWRQRTRQAARELASAVDSHVEATELPDTDDDEPLRDWLRRVYVMAWRTFNGPRFRQGRRYYNAGQAVACLLLMHRKKLSCRGAVLFFEQHPELCRAIGFSRVPHYCWFSRAGDVATLSRRDLELLMANNGSES